MKDILLNPGVLAFGGTIFSGVGLAAVNHFFGKRKAKEDAGAAIRTELRLQIEGLKADLATKEVNEEKLELKHDELQARYWELMADKTRLETEALIAAERFRVLEQKYDDIIKDVGELK